MRLGYPYLRRASDDDGRGGWRLETGRGTHIRGGCVVEDSGMGAGRLVRLEDQAAWAGTPGETDGEDGQSLVATAA